MCRSNRPRDNCWRMITFPCSNTVIVRSDVSHSCSFSRISCASAAFPFTRLERGRSIPLSQWASNSQRRRSQSGTRVLLLAWQSIRWSPSPLRVPALPNRPRRLASVRPASIRTSRTIYSPTNHCYRAVAAVEIPTAALEPGVYCPQPGRGKLGSFPRRARCGLEPLTRLL